ncbi:CPBP family glutamic-type intramembrane protease [Bacillus sp. FJAT-53711]|uniref:CPBP family glutamic-type intramembrane protease n=1 Tax=Bacillus yunxiaonensis TaxID=3127665 RepID=A0ABU8G2M1_9BACI
MDQSKKLWLIGIVLISRTVFAILVQGSISLVTNLSFLEAGRWWTVYGSLIDICCFILLLWVFRKDGISFRSVINFNKQEFKRDLKRAGILFVIIIPLTVVWGNVMSYLLFGNPEAPIVAGPLPLWAALYSVIIWPIGWAIIEQVIYMGYSLPSLEKLFKNKTLAITIVMFFWAIQHIALPVTLNLEYSTYRFLTVLPMVIMPIAFFKTKRLFPLILVHAVSDMISSITFYFMP